MDIEFHYYMTYLTATRAGFPPSDAETLAYSSQYVDENSQILPIDRGKPTAYHNYITQTLNILKPKHELMRIYPIFHFIPGDPLASTAQRKDGQQHRLNTTPNSVNANLIFDDALRSDNLYRIGIAAHSYVDTWAHQNFVGYYNAFNAMRGILSKTLPNIGHADAKHQPDWPALVWLDERLIEANEVVNNSRRFMDAAKHLFHKLRRYVDPSCPETTIQDEFQLLHQDLMTAIGQPDSTNIYQAERIQRYCALSHHDVYGGRPLPVFDEKQWFEQAIHRTVRGVSDDNTFWAKLDPLKDEYTWKDNYQHSHWYQFQEAAKEQQASALAILKEQVFGDMTFEHF